MLGAVHTDVVDRTVFGVNKRKKIGLARRLEHFV